MLGREELIGLLEQNGIPFACENHEQVLNMAESGELKLSLEGARCKNLLLHDKQGKHFLIMTTADKALDLSALARTLSSKRLSFVSADQLFTMLGVRPGSLSPLALVNDTSSKVRLVIDEDLSQEPVFLLHPLDNTATVALSGRDLEAFLCSVDHTPAWMALAGR